MERVHAAKQAANQLVDSLPETAVMGMLVYGASESNAPDNRERGCEDIDVLAPVERIDKETLRGEIDGLEPQGYTPMGNALRAAADELGSEGERSIIWFPTALILVRHHQYVTSPKNSPVKVST